MTLALEEKLIDLKNDLKNVEILIFVYDNDTYAFVVTQSKYNLKVFFAMTQYDYKRLYNNEAISFRNESYEIGEGPLKEDLSYENIEKKLRHAAKIYVYSLSAQFAKWIIQKNTMKIICMIEKEEFEDDFRKKNAGKTKAMHKQRYLMSSNLNIFVKLFSFFVSAAFWVFVISSIMSRIVYKLYN